MTKFFISYRREDAGFATDMLYQELKKYVENPRRDIYLDVDSNAPGTSWHDQLFEALNECDVFFAMIGRHWIDVSDKNGERRICKSDDWVRLEIAAALKRNVPVVPVLLDHDSIPSADKLPTDLHALCNRQAFCVSRRRFDSDVTTLMRSLGFQRLQKSKPQRLFSTLRIISVFIGVLLLIAILSNGLLRNPLSFTHAIATIWDSILADAISWILKPLPWNLEIDIWEARILSVFSIFFAPVAWERVQHAIRIKDVSRIVTGSLVLGSSVYAMISLPFFDFRTELIELPVDGRFSLAQIVIGYLWLMVILAYTLMWRYNRALARIIFRCALVILIAEGMFYLQMFGEFSEWFSNWSECNYGEFSHSEDCLAAETSGN